jgi:uncharacterized Ntn-hydrolase superfamily protein
MRGNVPGGWLACDDDHVLARARKSGGHEAANPAWPEHRDAHAPSVADLRLIAREVSSPPVRTRQGTYSIVACDPETGELGVAVQSHWFSVGPIVPWAAPGIGAIATQAFAEVSYGPNALELLREGVGAEDALARLVQADSGAAGRQVAIVDARGDVAVHTGPSCIAFAGHSVGAGVSCQANMMASERVWPAMLDAFNAASGSLAARLLTALDAAEGEGGDARGRQSAAMLVVPAQGEWWEATVSLRVEDDPEPLAELRRLLRLHDAYELAGEADELVNEGRHDEAAELYRRASELAPDNHELRFWAGLGVAQAGDLDAGVAHVLAAIEQHPGWRELLARLPGDVAPSASAVLAAIGAR